ncbi:regulator of RNase E activity RraA [Luteibacter sp. Sphag1AF]|uniref:RraA family protein n=1 Tax=Luteibacter sp. Sphag1AF TaxID=2587031 RepID=UPI00160A9C7A|nr:RraA family protein [Luteibacter sp. Sphag1AF]MBB3226451.1 regulator of RNase E activity RraA [Luteibacter sp. Sphag1AF]
MNAVQLRRTFLDLTTPHIADACMRLGIPVRFAPAGMRPLWENARVVGRARPARHYGSVDVFLEAISHASPGDVLVIDNGNRQDEACVGDLVALEASRAGISGIVIWGLHRDTTDLKTIRLPVFSTGTLPVGPQRLDRQEDDALACALCGPHRVTADDVVVGDSDGVLFIPLARASEVAEVAATIRDTERSQAALMLMGTSLREQTRFDAFLAARRANPSLTFRQHLRSVGGEIEE